MRKNSLEIYEDNELQWPHLLFKVITPLTLNVNYEQTNDFKAIYSFAESEQFLRRDSMLIRINTVKST